MRFSDLKELRHDEFLEKYGFVHGYLVAKPDNSHLVTILYSAGDGPSWEEYIDNFITKYNDPEVYTPEEIGGVVSEMLKNTEKVEWIIPNCLNMYTRKGTITKTFTRI